MKKTFLLPLLFCIVCCNNTRHKEPTLNVIDSTKIIDVCDAFSDEYSHPLESMMESVSIIPLETSDNSLISLIRSMEMSDNYIYILDLKSTVSIFDIKGNFIKQIAKGQGPEEISNARSICYDINKKLLYVYDSSQDKILKLSEDGTFIDKIYLPEGIGIEDFKVVNEDYLIIRQTSPSGDCIQYVSIADSTLQIKETVSIGNVNPRVGLAKYIHESDNGVIISKPLSKEKYSYRNGKFYKEYKINDNEEDIPLTGTSYGTKGIEETNKAIKSAKNYVYYGEYWETQNYQGFPFMPCQNNGKTHYKLAIRNKNTGEIIGNSFVINSFNNHFDPLHINVSKYSDNIIYSYFMPHTLLTATDDYRWDGSNPNNLISPEDMQKLRNLKEDDNPVIVLFKLKSE